MFSSILSSVRSKAIELLIFSILVFGCYVLWNAYQEANAKYEKLEIQLDTIKKSQEISAKFALQLRGDIKEISDRTNTAYSTLQELKENDAEIKSYMEQRFPDELNRTFEQLYNFKSASPR